MSPLLNALGLLFFAPLGILLYDLAARSLREHDHRSTQI